MTEDLDRWRRLTDNAIGDILATSRASVSTAVPASHEILEPIERYALGGKRLRALLLLASHHIHGGLQENAAVQLAAALEMFQTAALVHDDVLDGSDTRRGGPAAHRMIGALHSRQAWHGESDAFGEAGAVLAGDVALMACQRAVGRACALVPDQAAHVSDLFADMTDLVTAGQYADMRAAAQPLEAIDGQEDEIRAVMRAKTASYTAEYPLVLGAALAGASAPHVEAMRAAGRDLGVAFQLRDDVLGLVGQPETTGKPAGDDLREGKRTMLVWHAWRHGEESVRAHLRSVLGDRDATEDALAAATRAIVATGAIAAVDKEIEDLAARAREILRTMPATFPGVASLHALVGQLVDRAA